MNVIETKLKGVVIIEGQEEGRRRETGWERRRDVEEKTAVAGHDRR